MFPIYATPEFRRAEQCHVYELARSRTRLAGVLRAVSSLWFATVRAMIGASR